MPGGLQQPRPPMHHGAVHHYLGGGSPSRAIGKVGGGAQPGSRASRRKKKVGLHGKNSEPRGGSQPRIARRHIRLSLNRPDSPRMLRVRMNAAVIIVREIGCGWVNKIG